MATYRPCLLGPTGKIANGKWGQSGFWNVLELPTTPLQRHPLIRQDIDGSAFSSAKLNSLMLSCRSVPAEEQSRWRARRRSGRTG